MNITRSFHHTPVLLTECLNALNVQPGGRYIDATVGEGGHALAILEASSPGGQLLGIDADPQAVNSAKRRLQPFEGSFVLVNENFVNLEEIASSHGFCPVHGILFDLGLSSLQLEEGRGFSFQREAPLDMRLSPDQEVTATEIVNTLPLDELVTLLETYGEERNARRIARYIVESRPLHTTLELAQVVRKALGERRGRIHPATKTFQALRIVVNRELENLASALKKAINLLGYGGRLVVISYHSLEDRTVKSFIVMESKGCLCPPGTPICICAHSTTLKLITKKAITPSPDEVQINPRSRSAKMRAAERI